MGAREMDDEKQLKQKLYQKRNKKILAVIVILSAVIFCIVIFLRFGVFFKMISPYPTLQNMIYNDKNEDCKYSYRKIATEICLENKNWLETMNFLLIKNESLLAQVLRVGIVFLIRLPLSWGAKNRVG